MRSIKKQLFFLFIFVATILTLLIFGAMRFELSRNVLPLNQSITQQFVDNRTNQINSWFGERIAELRLIADLPARHSYTRESLFDETFALENQNQRNYLSIRLVSREGVSYSRFYENFSVKERSYFKELVQHPELDYTVSDLLHSKEDQQAAVIILYRLNRPLQDGTNFISAAIPLSNVQTLAKDLALYDGKGTLVGADNQSPKINEKKEILFTSGIDLLPDWKVNYIVPKKSLGGTTNQLWRLLFIITVIVLSLLAILLLLLSRKIIAPILALSNTMAEVKKGNRNIRADIQSPQEIAQLATTFNQTLDKVYENEALYRQASVQVLQTQIQPHFLYNTLDLIQWQVLGNDIDQAVTTIEYLSTFFRKGLNRGNELITIEDELAHVESYLQIQQLRHEELQSFTIHVPEELRQQTMLHFLLQPLVENAINHGIRPLRERPSSLAIEVTKLTTETIRIQVKNTGLPIPEEKLIQLNSSTKTPTSTGYGIANIRQRLQLFYGLNAHLLFFSSTEETIAQIDLPIEKEEKNDDTINH
ncbi:sensor histidine kinase [Enterococcus songbeiensis]